MEIPHNNGIQLVTGRDTFKFIERLSRNNTVIASRNVFETFNEVTGSSIEVTKQVTDIPTNVLLSIFLDFAKQRSRANSTRDFCPVRCIVLEIESYISNEAEEFILLYLYLLRTGSTLPRLFILMTCRVKAIIEVLSSILNVTVPNWEVPSITLTDYIMTPANFIDVTSSVTGKKPKCIILDPNNDELYNDVGERCRTFTELLESITPDTNVVRSTSSMCDIVCISPTIRVQTSSLYTGNRRVRRSVTDEYLIEAINVIKGLHSSSVEVRSSIRVVIPKEHSLNNIVCFREALSKDFSQDIMNFARSGLSLQMIYKYYSLNDGVIRSRIAQNQALIEKLGFITQSRTPLTPESFLITSLKVHPLIAKVIHIWVTEMNKPVFPILLFVAVIHSFERTVSEVKEHGLKETDGSVENNSKYGELMGKALSTLARTGQADSPDLGRLGILLKRLINKAKEYFKDKPVTPVTFDLERFTLLLSSLLKEHFPTEILTRIPDGQKTGTILYRNIKHPQILWKVNNNPSYNEIFPIISMLERNSNRVLLYVPI